MSPACCHRTEDGTLVPYSGVWESSGTGSRTECWTLNMSEWNHTLVRSPNGDDVCSLSDILEAGVVPRRYSLKPMVCMRTPHLAEESNPNLSPVLRQMLLDGATQHGNTLP